MRSKAPLLFSAIIPSSLHSFVCSCAGSRAGGTNGGAGGRVGVMAQNRNDRGRGWLDHSCYVLQAFFWWYNYDLVQLCILNGSK